MKGRKFAMLALLGINMGLMLNSCQSARAEEEMTPDMRTYYEQLSPQAKRQFNTLDAEHRRAAMSSTYSSCGSPHGCVVSADEAVRKQYEAQNQGH